MVDAGIKKSKIQYADLPHVSFDQDGIYYALRYRILSEDKNRLSHWSNIVRVNVPPTSDADLPYTSTSRIHLNKIGTSIETIMISWNFPQESEYNVDPEKAKIEKIFNQTEHFDIFVRWNPNNSPDDTSWSDWQYEASINSFSFSTLKPDPLGSPYLYTPKQIQLSVNIAATTKEYNGNLSLFKIAGNI